jgi:hypothetical protein
MPETKKPTPTKLPTDEQLFAAIDRAERHRGTDRGVHLATVKEHLGLKRGGWSTIQMRPQLDRLQAEGLIEQFRRAGCKAWSLTEAGHRRLTYAQRMNGIPLLPEAPQHRVWREARSQAEEQIDSILIDMRERLTAAASLLAAGDEVGSDRWIAMGQRLHFGCERLASVTYCLHDGTSPMTPSQTAPITATSCAATSTAGIATDRRIRTDRPTLNAIESPNGTCATRACDHAQRCPMRSLH